MKRNNLRFRCSTIAVRTVLLAGCGFLAPSFAAEQLPASENSDKGNAEIVKKRDEKNATEKKLESSEDKNLLVVVGIRGSLKDNLNNKRKADAIVDSLNTEDIAKNPDKNLAEALQRISGVQIEREFGEGTRISIRGTRPEFTNTLLNGQNISTPQQLPLRQESNAFDFSTIAAEQISKIEVYKSPQADIDAGGIGGTVILHTKKPLERESGSGYATIENEYNDGSGKNQPQLKALYSWKDDSDTFGASINVSYQERNLQRDGNEAIAGWFGYYRDDHPEQIPNSVDDYPAYSYRTGLYEKPGAHWGIPGSARYTQNKKRQGATVSFEYEPIEDLDLSLEYTYNYSDNDNQSRNMFLRAFRLARWAYSGRDAGSLPGYSVDRELDLLLHADALVSDIGSVNSRGVRYGSAREDVLSMEFQDRNGSWSSNDSLNFTTEWTTDDLLLKVQAGRTTGKAHVSDFGTQFRLNDPANNPSLAGVGVYYDYDPAANFPGWGVTGGADNWLENPTDEMYLFNMFKQTQDRENSENFYQADLTWQFENDWDIASVKFGVKSRKLDRDSKRFSSAATFVDRVTAGELAGGVVSGIRSDIGTFPTSYFDVNRSARDALWDGLLPIAVGEDCQAQIDASGNSAYRGCNTPFDELVEGSFPSYINEQDIDSYYAMANFSGDFYRGNIGARVVKSTRSDITYAASGTDANGETTYSPVITESSTTDVLPSFNIAFDLDDDLILRGAWAKTISHPSLTQLRDSLSINSNFINPADTSSILAEGSQRRGRRGNPNLGSYESRQYEMGLEWYFDDASLLSVNYFRKDLTDLIRSQTELQNLTDSGEVDNQGQVADGQYLLTSYYNVGQQDIRGWEAQYQHDFGNGFGVIANYTYVDVPSEVFTFRDFEPNYELDSNGNPVLYGGTGPGTGEPLVTGFDQTDESVDEIKTGGNSKNAANLQGYYETDVYSLRLAYNYRSHYFVAPDSQAERVVDTRNQLDFKATYRILDDLEASFSVYNLTNQNKDFFLIRDQIEAPEGGIAPGLEAYYGNRTEKVAHNSYQTGRRFYLGLNYRF